MQARKEEARVKNYQVISADSHWETPPEAWAPRVPAKFQDRLPKTIKLPNGGDGVMDKDGRVTYGGTAHFCGHGPEAFDPTILHYDREAGYGGPEQRVQDQELDGVDAEILFRFTPRDPDADLVRAMVRAENEWLAEEFCSYAPDRLLGVGLLANRGVDEDIAEMENCKKMGLRAVHLTRYPSGKSIPTPEDDRFYAAALDLDMPLCVHTQMALKRGDRGDFMIQYPKEPEGYDRPPIDIVDRMSRYGTTHCGCLEVTQMVMTGVFDRFPDLKIYFAENQCGWVPIFLEQMDMIYEANKHWVERILGLPKLECRPSEYVREHIYWGFFDDPIGMRLRHDIGVDHLLWGSDFPHEVSRWPNSMENMDEQFSTAAVTGEERQMMLVDNAARFFHLDR
jgi:predicted TIM-barrel fold metal-dependent hydrolase